MQASVADCMAGLPFDQLLRVCFKQFGVLALGVQSKQLNNLSTPFASRSRRGSTLGTPAEEERFCRCLVNPGKDYIIKVLTITPTTSPGTSHVIMYVLIATLSKNKIASSSIL